EICIAEEIFKNNNIVCSKATNRLYCVELQVDDVVDGTGNAITHVWWLGDGSMKPGVSIEHCYNIYGKYEVTLVSSKNVKGVVYSDSTTYLLDVGQIALIQEVKQDHFTYFFDASGSFIGDDFNIQNYYWSFGDGNYACDMLVSNTYVKPGDYEVKLIVEGVSSTGETKKICGVKMISIL
ncbi:MAG: PKD domain-containing protein, partial [Bacteroidota bacterium]